MDKLRELVAKWRAEAQVCVPPEYADRNLHYKYLKLDNYAAGLDDAADELDELLASQEPSAANEPLGLHKRLEGLVALMHHNGRPANESSHVDAECWKCRLEAELARTAPPPAATGPTSGASTQMSYPVGHPSSDICPECGRSIRNGK